MTSKQRKERSNGVRKERGNSAGVRSSHELKLAWRWRLAPYPAEVDTGSARPGGGARDGKLSPLWRALDGHIVADRAESALTPSLCALTGSPLMRKG